MDANNLGNIGNIWKLYMLSFSFILTKVKRLFWISVIIIFLIVYVAYSMLQQVCVDHDYHLLDYTVQMLSIYIIVDI